VDVEAKSAQDRVFPADAVVNVTRPPYGATPDDGTDDTAALQRAISENAGTGRVLYFPAGTYNISDTLVAKNPKGIWEARLTLQGQGRNKVTLRLADNAPGFSDKAHPKAMIMTGSHFEPGDSLDGGGNKAFGNYLFDLAIDTGSKNPGAIGIEYAVSNFGAIQDVTIRSGDGQGVAGIAMRRKIPGPGLIKNIGVTGFDVGIDVGDIQYGITLEDVEVRDQKIAGIRLGDNLLHVRHLKSSNRVPAVLVTGGVGVLTLLDSQLAGGASDQPAIDCAGSLLLRDITTEGYRPAALRWHGKDVAGPNYAQWSGPPAIGASESASLAGLLPIEETPEYWNPDLSDWIAVGARQAGEADDASAIQRAIDSGKGTVYFPNDRTYFLSDTVVVRGAVRQVLGMGSEISLGAAKIPFSEKTNPRPLIRIDPTASEAVFLEGLFFNAQYPGEVIFENNSPKAVVIKHCAGWVGADGFRRSYRNTKAGTGKLFMEDVFLPGWEFKNQTVWARQFNPENYDGDGFSPQVLNSRGKLWILGFKTEGPAPFIATADGGVTELLGAYNYISATKSLPATAVPYLIADSRAALTFATDNFRDHGDYQVYIREFHGGETRDIKPAGLWPRNGNPGGRSLVVPLYQTKN
jgi:hypothetical protein